jgi:hypothetical protein
MKNKENNMKNKENNMKNNVKVLKLVTGEDLITRVTEEQDGIFFIEYPMIVQQAPPDESGRMSLSLIPWSLSGKTEKVVLEAKNILAILEVTDEMAVNYNSVISYEESLVSAQPTNIINN